MKSTLVCIASIALVSCNNDSRENEISQAIELTDRHEEVAERGKEVMPFDLDATTHFFEKTTFGGRQQVIAKDPDDSSNIEPIRSHLTEISEKFSRGDFHDPAVIHGEHMPGLHDLMMGADRIKIEYNELPQGGQILYRSEDEKLIAAIHKWFDAQVSDHGDHAVGSHL